MAGVATEPLGGGGGVFGGCLGGSGLPFCCPSAGVDGDDGVFLGTFSTGDSGVGVTSSESVATFESGVADGI